LHLVGAVIIERTIAEFREQAVSRGAEGRYSGEAEIVRRAHGTRNGRKRSTRCQYLSLTAE
jgi:hypothetical protein